MDWVLLLPENLTPREGGMLRAALRSQRVPEPMATRDRIEPGDRLVLSVGKSALDTWHEFGLILVGANHGDVFRHRTTGTAAGVARIMVLEHPGAMLQLKFDGRQARENYKRDLGLWRGVLEGGEVSEPRACGGCLKSKGNWPRVAAYWVDELDGVGLCEDHWRRRARYRVKRAKKPNPSSREAQMAGQLEGFGFVGERAVVAKG